METIKINFNRPRKKDIDFITGYLRAGKVIVYPTDTIYGIGCSAERLEAIKRIFKIKRRREDKPFIFLVPNLKTAEKFCRLSSAQKKFLESSAFKERPTSVIVKKKKILSSLVTAGSDSVAIRIPNLPNRSFLIKILEGLEAPLVSTSLNISGKKSLVGVSGLEKYFKTEKPDLVVDAGELRGRSSRIIDIRDIRNIKIIRP